MTIADRIISVVTRRAPDVLIGADNPPTYLTRWWVIPRNRVFNVYLHQFRRSDDDRAHHTHPWAFNVSIVLRGMLVEHVIERGGLVRKHLLLPGCIRFRLGSAPHRLELPDGCEAWTLFITGPVVRQWGFLCGERGFIHHKRFTAPGNGGEIGAGCDA
ncbi:MAG: hypothetical protein EOP39_04310 [Rubrivivax sp.]|nr:MAG: hypothetical protein EOP39_04310 [Rubrivivax sp.]